MMNKTIVICFILSLVTQGMQAAVFNTVAFISIIYGIEIYRRGKTPKLEDKGDIPPKHHKRHQPGIIEV